MINEDRTRFYAGINRDDLFEALDGARADARDWKSQCIEARQQLAAFVDYFERRTRGRTYVSSRRRCPRKKRNRND